jgi:hypothetical protein
MNDACEEAVMNGKRQLVRIVENARAQHDRPPDESGIGYLAGDMVRPAGDPASGDASR